jgi:hypothetical protein
MAAVAAFTQQVKRNIFLKLLRLRHLHARRSGQLLFLGSSPRLVATARLVLRAWSAGYQDPQNGRPLLLGSIVNQRAIHPANLLSLETAQPAASAEVRNPSQSGATRKHCCRTFRISGSCRPRAPWTGSTKAGNRSP